MTLVFMKLASVLGLSLTSGINLYATVAVVGLVTKFDLIKGLPPEFQAFNNDFIIIVALVLYACEFAADKIPAFDTVWDSVHTVIRPFGAALIAMTVVGESGPAVEIFAGLMGATLGLATHTAKAGTRLVANTSPEPFSNAALSLGEDVAVVGMSVLVMSHPFVSLAISIAVVGLLIGYGPGLVRSARLVLRAVVARVTSTTGKAPAVLLAFLPDAIQETVDEQVPREEPIRASQPCYARKVKGCGWNRQGYLILTDRRLLFVFRRFFKTRTKRWDLSELEKPATYRRFLVDVLRVKSEARFVNFIFFKNRSEVVAQLEALLAEATSIAETRRLAEDQRKVIPLNAGSTRPA